MASGARGYHSGRVDGRCTAWQAFAAVDEQLLRLRRRTYALFVELGRAPSAAEVASELQIAESAVRSGWEELHEAHALVLDAGTRDIRMANPLSAVPTRYRVRAAGREWFANCGWDAFGICAALQVDGSIDSECPDCGEALHIEVRGQKPDVRDLAFHCLVPASQWWDDIVFT